MESYRKYSMNSILFASNATIRKCANAPQLTGRQAIVPQRYRFGDEATDVRNFWVLHIHDKLRSPFFASPYRVHTLAIVDVYNIIMLVFRDTNG
jgi:hypothetical protein